MEYIGVHQMKLNMIGGHMNRDPELLTVRPAPSVPTNATKALSFLVDFGSMD